MKSDPTIEFEYYLTTSNSESELEYFLRNSLTINIPYVEIRESVIFHKGNIRQIFESLPINSEFDFELINKEILAGRLQRILNDDSKYTGTFCILKTAYKSIYRLITVSRGDFWNHAIIPFIRHLYPKLAPLHFTNNEMEKSLFSFERKLNTSFPNRIRLNIVEVTRKTQRQLNTKSNYKIIDTERSWTRTSIGDSFIELKERGFWITNLKVRIDVSNKKRNTVTAFCKVNKKGYFSCTGLYNEIRSLLIDELEHYAVERMQLLEYRGIVERDFIPGPPLEILYEEDVFDSNEKIKDFGELINHYQSASIVTYHCNPYFHANIADQDDGSSFELWVLSKKRILISPQATSSPQALSRMIGFIFDRFKEGKVSEYQPSPE